VTTEFDRQGWLVVRRVVAESELTRLLRSFDALIREVACPGGLLAINRPAVFGAFAQDRRFASLVQAALDCASVQLLQDSVLYKPAQDGGSVKWHQDHTYVGYLTPPRVVSLRIALVAEDERSGCMRVVDGSHRWGPVSEVRALSEPRIDSVLPLLSPEKRAAVESARSLELEAGDVSLHHCLTLHGSGPNRTGRPRKTIILRMFDGECRLDRSRLPLGAEVHFPTDENGRLSTSAFPRLIG
jgi:ectoine hydroxylase-related dioxygenase (phytanoyl-CoA dioxygenase family)